MSYANWTEHPDSDHDYAEGRSSDVVPGIGGGVNAWNLIAPSGANLKRICYVNDGIRSAGGSHEVSGVFRLKAGAENVRVGLIAMWDGLNLDDLDRAYVIELKAETGGMPTLRVRKGPSELGELLLGPSAPLAFDTWYQIVLRMKFDQLHNLQLHVAISEADNYSVLAPNYIRVFDPLIITKLNARFSGKMAFFVESRQSNFEVYADSIAAKSELSLFGVLGTYANTLDGVVTAAFSQVQINGVYAATLGGVTTAAVGELQINGAYAATLGGVTTASDAVVQVDGVYAATLGGVTTAAVGELQVNGAYAATLGGVTTAAVGDVRNEPVPTLLEAGNTTAGASSFNTGSISPTANLLNVLYLISADAGGGDPGIPDVTGGGHASAWVQVNSVQLPGGASDRRVTAFRNMSASPGSGAVNIDFVGGGSQNSICWSIIQVTNVPTTGDRGADAIVQSDTEFGNSPGSTLTLAAFEHINNIHLLGVGLEIASTVTPDGNFTELSDQNQTLDDLTLEVEWARNQTACSPTHTSTRHGSVGIEIKAA